MAYQYSHQVSLKENNWQIFFQQGAMWRPKKWRKLTLRKNINNKILSYFVPFMESYPDHWNFDDDYLRQVDPILYISRSMVNSETLCVNS